MFNPTDPLLVLAVVLVAGMSLGAAAKRLRLPSISGQIVAGVLLGQAGLGLFEREAVEALQPLTHFALALIGVTVGAHLNLARLRNAGKRLFYLLIAEATITPVLVGGVLYGLGDLSLTTGMLFAALAVSTAPATIVALVRETRATGVFVKTVIAAVAINNMACIFLFEVARGAGSVLAVGELASGSPIGGMGGVFLDVGARLGAALLLGGAAAWLTQTLTLRVVRSDRLATVSAVSILLTFGLASHLGLSPLLACMALGMVQTNLNPSRDRLVDSVFENFEPAIL
ncbi:MAG: hypothetical protein GY725_22465, partial [bacterium]|nr:hypothetical protein [bacterium]